MTAQLVQKKAAGREAASSAEVGLMRAAGLLAIAAVVTMAIGAALWGTSGTDLWAALANDEMASYLAAAGAVRGQLVANLSVWILGVILFGMAGAMLVKLRENRPFWAQLALVSYQIAVPLVIVSYIAMLAVVVQIAPDTSATAVALAEVVGWIGARADDLATVLILGAGPLFLSLAARGRWLPKWLVGLGVAAALAGLLSVVTLFVPALWELNFAILPFGMIWTLAVGVVLLRRAGSGREA